MPYQKGQSGNLKGRPKKGLALSDIICVKLAEKGKDKKRHIDAIIDAAVILARAGDKDARNWLAERGWGKPIQPVTGEVTHTWHLSIVDVDPNGKQVQRNLER